jgi:hypothetical protein
VAAFGPGRPGWSQMRWRSATAGSVQRTRISRDSGYCQPCAPIASSACATAKSKKTKPPARNLFQNVRGESEEYLQGLKPARADYVTPGLEAPGLLRRTVNVGALPFGEGKLKLRPPNEQLSDGP